MKSAEASIKIEFRICHNVITEAVAALFSKCAAWLSYKVANSDYQVVLADRNLK